MWDNNERELDKPEREKNLENSSEEEDLNDRIETIIVDKKIHEVLLSHYYQVGEAPYKPFFELDSMEINEEFG